MDASDQRLAQPPDAQDPAAASPWRGALPPLVGSTTLAVLSLVARYTTAASETALARLGAVLLAAVAVCFAARADVHRTIGYWSDSEPERADEIVEAASREDEPGPVSSDGASGQGEPGLRRTLLWALRVVLVLNTTISTALIAAAVYLWQDPDARTEFYVACSAIVVIFASSVAMSFLIDALGKDRGSEHADEWLPGIWLRNVAKKAKSLRICQCFIKLWERKTPPDQLSSFVLWLLGALAAVGVLCAPAAVPDALELLSRKPSTSPLPPREKSTTTTTTATDSTAPGTQNDQPPAKPNPPREPPTYAQLCGRRSPGAPAPEPQRRALADQWLGPRPGGLGAVFAGCVKPAQQMSVGAPWIQEGWCGDELRSLASATADGIGGIVLWEAAESARQEAQANRLLSVETGVLAGSGDLSAVQTTYGTWVFVHATLRPGGSANPYNCSEYEQPGGPPIAVPPGLVGLWRGLMYATGRAYWPTWRSSGSRPTRFIFSAPGGGRAPVRAVCDMETKCHIRAAGYRVDSGAGVYVGLQELADQLTG